MKVFLIDTHGKPQIIDTPGGLPEWRRLIGCDLIDIVSWKIGGRRFDIILDDEGLFKPGARVSALDDHEQPAAVGNLVVCRHDGRGHEVTLTENDLKHILTNIVILQSTEEEPEPPAAWAALANINY